MMYVGCVTPLVLCILHSVQSEIMLGSLLEPGNSRVSQAIQWSAQAVNRDSHLLPDTLLHVYQDQVEKHDSFSAQKKVCKMMSKGVSTFFGPVTPPSKEHVASMCDAFDIPTVQWSWNPHPGTSYFTINLFPKHQTLGLAYRDMVRLLGWGKFTVLYENNDVLALLEEVLEAEDMVKPDVSFQKLPTKPKDLDVMFQQVKAKNHFRFLVDCDLSSVKKILDAASKAEMLTQNFQYFFTTLDLGWLDLEKYQGANFVSMRLVDPKHPEVVQMQKSWQSLAIRDITWLSPAEGYDAVYTEIALVYDGIQLLARALHELAQTINIEGFEAPSCDNDSVLVFGNSLLNYIKLMDFEGLSGRIWFDRAERKDIILGILQLSGHRMEKVGTWDSQQGMNVTEEAMARITAVGARVNRTLENLATEEVPYVMAVAHGDGSMTYEGLCVDVRSKLAPDFNFTVKPFQKFGECTDGRWSGSIEDMLGKMECPLCVPMTEQQIKSEFCESSAVYKVKVKKIRGSMTRVKFVADLRPERKKRLRHSLKLKVGDKCSCDVIDKLKPRSTIGLLMRSPVNLASRPRELVLGPETVPVLLTPGLEKKLIVAAKRNLCQ